jgi:sulfoxide reductase heme-binding subunit YedZ
VTTVALVTPPSPLWFVARASGAVALLLLTLSVLLGIAAGARWRTPSWPRWMTAELHRLVVLLCFAFLAVHVLTLLLDPFMRFTLADVAVPLASGYRRIGMGLGIVAAELALALAVSVRLRPRIGYRAWRRLHQATHVLLPLALLHGVLTGTDGGALWAVALYGLCTASVAAAVLARMAATRAAWGLRLTLLTTGGVAAAVVVAGALAARSGGTTPAERPGAAQPAPRSAGPDPVVGAPRLGDDRGEGALPGADDGATDR